MEASGRKRRNLPAGKAEKKKKLLSLDHSEAKKQTTTNNLIIHKTSLFVKHKFKNWLFYIKKVQCPQGHSQ